jgi:4-amino-4-deoxychorismate lyase
VNGERGPVPWNAPAVERGVGFFETALLVGRRAVLWEPHVERLLGTLGRFELPSPGRGELERCALGVVDAARPDPSGQYALRLTWIAVGADLDAPSSWRLDVSVRPIPETRLARRSGSHAVTLPAELCRDTPTVKSTSYFAPIAGLRFATKRGADEGLFVNADGSYREGTATALVAWNGGRLLIPDGGFLPSVTAAAFHEGAAPRGPVRAEDLMSGAVVAGSLTLAAPLLTLDGRPCACPEAMRARVRLFNEKLLSDPVFGCTF